MKHSMAPAPGDFLNNRASASVIDAWVAFERRSPRKSTSALRRRRVGRVIGSGSAVDWSGEDVGGALEAGGSPGPAFPSDAALSFLWKLFIDAQAFTKVPSTEI